MVLIYLGSIVLANLIITHFGPGATFIVAFLFIGLDLTSRDTLHERWKNNHLILKMLILISIGSLISYLLNKDAGPIALASFVAFTSSALIDTFIYYLLGDKSKLLRINGSNVFSAAADSFLFIWLAFGTPVLWIIVLKQFLAKTCGGFIWSLIIERTLFRR